MSAPNRDNSAAVHPAAFTVSCAGCQAPIPAKSFMAWSISGEPLYASCHGCLQQMSVSAADLAALGRPTITA